MFYVNRNKEESENGDSSVPQFAFCKGSGKEQQQEDANKSATLKSVYKTPPESPDISCSNSNTLVRSEEVSTMGDDDEKPPVPPPRTRRGQKSHSDKSGKLQRTSTKTHDDDSNTQLLEAVANDLLGMGDELDQQRASLNSTASNGQETAAAAAVADSSKTSKSNKPADELLKGYLHMLVISAKGLRHMMKTRWFVYDKKCGRLRYYRSEIDEASGEPVGDIDISSATFCYDVEADNSGEFTICTKMGEHVVSAGSAEKRMYWLQQLQRARRDFSQGGAAAARNSVASQQMGLLKTPENEDSPPLTAGLPGDGTSKEEGKEMSPFKDLMATLEKPSDMTAYPANAAALHYHHHHHSNVISPPKSADYCSKKTSFFQSFTRNRPNFRLPRSSSMRTPSPPASTHSGMLSPPHNKPLGASSTPGSFQALTKIRKSLRDKKSASSAGLTNTGGSSPWGGVSPAKTSIGMLGRSSSEAVDRELINVKEDLQAVKDEAAASKEVISILRKQIEELQKEKETLSSLQKPDLDDGHLLEILRSKDIQIVDLESETRERLVEADKLTSAVEKMKSEVTTYQDLIEVKDESIVRLTNQLHELELHSVIQHSTPASPGGPFNVGPTTVHNFPPLQPASAAGTKITCSRLTSSNGISFDSDKGEFKEYVDVGVQTSEKTNQCGAELQASENVLKRRIGEFSSLESDILAQDLEKLQDTVTAYEMQNKFLNKEVLELNQLRQQANDREQKLFIEASDWEAKFYQIQSKYLLLLNELHNPQVGVSASRQEMVSQLLKDIVETAERPSLAKTSASAAYDRFGFRIDQGSSDDDTLEDKAERLRKQAEDQHDKLVGDYVTESDENRESRWDDAIATLNSKVPFTMTTDIKNLLRLGIPISQRGAVWKAIVDHKLMRVQNEKFQADYYEKLLANYNPSRNLTPAAKQIELDLLRTLPNNKHYDSPHADGIPKLRRVLLAYSVHNPDVEYCQGFNRLVAIALLFMAEEDAFWCLVYIIEHLMTPEYYSRDKQLIGAQVDQEVLKELLAEKLPKLNNHFDNHGVDPALFTLNWFLCVFVDTVPVKTYLHIWDAFLFEGSKVLFRYAIAIFKYMESALLKQADYMSIYNTLRDGLEYLSDTQSLTQIAFHDLNPFPMRNITNKREHHYKVLEAQKKELDIIRQSYRKNSLARTPTPKKGWADGQMKLPEISKPTDEDE